MNFNYDDFMHRANADYLKYQDTQRYGQFLMNQLWREHPDIQVPESCDCFHDNNRCSNFMLFLSQLASQ